MHNNTIRIAVCHVIAADPNELPFEVSYRVKWPNAKWSAHGSSRIEAIIDLCVTTKEREGDVPKDFVIEEDGQFIPIAITNEED